MWSKHDLLRIAGAEITGKDTMKRMWSKHDLLRCIGAEITGKDTMRRMWSRDELIDLLADELADEYFNYAKAYYTATGNGALFANAWEHSLTVDPSAISNLSDVHYPRGKAKYPNGETEGVIIPHGVTTIGNHAFWGWTSNNKPLVIPDTVTSIGHSAFRYWTSNTYPLVIPDSVTSIDYNAFRDWESVPYVEIQAITPPSLADSEVFDGQNNAPIYVPDESVEAYKTATNWVSLANRIFPISEKP